MNTLVCSYGSFVKLSSAFRSLSGGITSSWRAVLGWAKATNSLFYAHMQVVVKLETALHEFYNLHFI